MYEKKKHEYWAGQQLLVDFPGGPVVGSPPANAGGRRFDPRSRKIPLVVVGQLGLCTRLLKPARREPVLSNK